MAVAWIGNREAPLERAVEQAARLLQSSRCPVFTFDTDVHGTRAAIALAELSGAAYDQIDGEPTAHETALFTDKGGMTIAPGEVRRRADVVVIVGGLPSFHDELVGELARTMPDLGGESQGSRALFTIGDEAALPFLPAGATSLSCDEADTNAILAAIRTQLAGRHTTAKVSNCDRFAAALAAAHFPVFLFSGHSANRLGLEMLQGLIADLNREGRASGLHLPASENGWGSTLASTWMTGFALRTGFARGFPEFDPWRFDVSRMIADGEADFHLRVAGQSGSELAAKQEVTLVALTNVSSPVTTAAVTIAIGDPGVDHDAVAYRGRTGTLAAIQARAASGLPSAASVIRAIGETCFPGMALPC